MIDDLVVVMDIDPPDKVLRRCCAPFEYLGLVFNPIYRNGLVTGYDHNLKNLRVKLISNKLILSGSWHKFYHGGNWGDYSWREIGETLKELLEVFGEPFLKGRITKLTFACNLPIEPGPILGKIKAIRSVPPSDMLGGTNHKAYGKYHRMTHYRFKIYDKQTEVNIHDKFKIGPVLRIEKEIRMRAAKARATNPIKIFTPFDLLRPEFHDHCLDELLNVVRSIEFTNSIQAFDLATNADLEAFLMMNDISIRNHFKQLVTPKTFRSKKKRYDTLVFEFIQDDLNCFLEGEVTNKIAELAEAIAHQKTR